MAIILGIDVGGTGIKAALVDTASGDLKSDRQRIPTPGASNPSNIAAVVERLVAESGYDGVVGCCFPSAIVDGVARTAGNIDTAWRGTSVSEVFQQATGLPFVVLNDADAAGIAEMRLGAGVGLDGLVIMLTIGTGIGSGMFYEGQLIPNSELGHMLGKDGNPIERYAGNRARKVNDLSWDDWGARLNFFLERTARVCTPDHFILGGGISKKFDLYRHTIKVPTPIHVARFQNNAGIIGAALAAESKTTDR